jgi:putative hydrolase of the HAD superfamily
MIRAVTFDVGGTLVQPWPSVGHIYAEAAADHGHPGLDPEALTRAFGDAWRTLRPRRHSRAEWAALVDATFAGLVPEPPSRTFFPALYDRFNDPACWRIFADVLPALMALHMSGLKLAVLSNWDERLRPLLAKLELAPAFAETVVSCEVGAAKPDRAIFEAAGARLGLRPDELLHIGDSPREDVEGALACGWNALLIDRGRAPAPGRLSSLGQLADHHGLRGAASARCRPVIRP